MFCSVSQRVIRVLFCVTACDPRVVLCQNVRWQWQYTRDPDPKTAPWTDMDSSALQTITTKSTTTASKCFNISITTLTLQRVSGADFGKSYRCYVINGNTEYVQRAAVYKLTEDTATGDQRLLA